MKIVSKAPCRVDMAGATLDIWPLYLFHTGAVTVNFAVDRYTTCTLETRSDGEFHITSADLRAKTVFRSFNDLSATAKLKLPLASYVLRFFRPSTGLTVETHSEAPAGAGISGSSAL